MPHQLELINKADRNVPAVYRFGRNKLLNIYLENEYAEITDEKTGACLQALSWCSLREMGYSPAKLLDGEEEDQFMDQYPNHDSTLINISLKSCFRYIVIIFASLIVGVAVGNLTGCNNYVLDQVDKDISTSTIHARNHIKAVQHGGF